MSGCCDPSSPTKKSKSRLGWWLLGGFVAVAGLSTLFQAHPLAETLTPVALGILALIWFGSLVKRQMGIGQ